MLETPARIEPARLEETGEAINDVVAEVLRTGLLASETSKGDLSLRFPAATLDALFPRLVGES